MRADDMGPRDVKVGQTWLHVVTESHRRLVWTVIDVVSDGVRMTCDGMQTAVPFGTLFTSFEIVPE